MGLMCMAAVRNSRKDADDPASVADIFLAKFRWVLAAIFGALCFAWRLRDQLILHCRPGRFDTKF